jgi:hypothetical protein
MIELTLVVLVGWLGAVLDEAQTKPASPAAPAQDSERPTIPAAELKALRENNIFAPRSAKFRPPKAPGGSSKGAPAAPVKPRAPVVTGIFFDEKLQAHRVMVEDKNDAAHKFFKEPMFMKVGDEWAGLKVEAVTPDKATFLKGGESKDVAIGESLPEVEKMPLSAASPDDESGLDDATPIPPDPASSPSSGKKSSSRNRGESRAETKSDPSENQSQTLENMKRRVKKNRPVDPEE